MGVYPPQGTGGGSSGVSQVVPGPGLGVSPAGGTGVVTVFVKAPASFSPNPPAGTASLTGVMMGLGGVIVFTPSAAGTGKIFILFTCQMTNTTANDGGSLGLCVGTGVAPINGAPPAGTQFGPTPSGTSVGGGSRFMGTYTINAVRTLTPGTAYWFDIDLLALTGGTASISNISCQIWEVD